MEQVNTLMAHAVKQYGRDRNYTVRFGGSTPIIGVYEDDPETPRATRIAEVWMVNGEIKRLVFP
jgi:hypothetical protein